MRSFILGFFILFLAQTSRAQVFGAYPPATRWRQINTDTARIIFTQKAEAQAQHIASIINRLAADTSGYYRPQLRKINVVLHSNTALANGYVALAPFRSEYYLIPGGNVFEFGNLPWHENLAVHEYRHVLQYNYFNRGLSKAFYYLFGENGEALANALSVPDWFFEGDAVYAETALTDAGRGRTPFFWNGYNSLWQEGKNYSWMKLRNGSYKDYVPNHYYLGYLLVNYGYLKYGPHFWQDVTKDASAYKHLIYPMQGAVKKYAGVSYQQFRNAALKHYSQSVTVKKEKPHSDKTVTDRIYPQWIGSDSLLYLKTGYDHIPAFYIQDKRGEHRLAQKSIGAEDWISYRAGNIVYTSYSINPRWGLQDYNDIVLLNLTTKKERRITRKKKYFSPDLSPSGNSIVAVSFSDSLQGALHFLNAETGNVERKISVPNATFFQPHFVDENRVVAALRTGDERMSIVLLDKATDAIQTLIPPTRNTVGFPTVVDNVLYFTGSFTGNDDLYSYSLKDKKLYQLKLTTTGKTGYYQAAVTGQQLAIAHFTAEGYKLEKWNTDSLAKIEINQLSMQETMVPYPVAGNYTNQVITRNRTFSVERYKKSTGLFHFHSWYPDYTDPEFSLSLYSDNILNTFSNEIFYRYNQNERSNTAGFSTIYGGLFPVLSAGAEYTFHRHITTTTRRLLYDQYELRAGFSIPLNFTYGKTYKYLNFGSDIVNNKLLPQGQYKDSLSARTVQYLYHFISWQQQLPRAVQQIYPKLGYAFSVQHRHQLSQKGYQFLGNGAVYLPSVFKNHSLVFTGSFQQTDTGNVVFSNRFAASSGYREYYFSRMWRASANYHFPLAYPDWGLGNIVYFLRVRSNVFYNYTKVYSADKSRTRNLRSTGTEIWFDTKWWNQLPVTFGVRYSYLLDPEITGSTARNRWEIILPVDLITN